MAQIIWIEPAVQDLDAIADYIALVDPDAANRLANRIFARIGQLANHPEMGSRPRELGRHSRYRQIVEPPCRIFYRHDAARCRVYILHVMRGEMLLRASRLAQRNPKN